MMQQLAILARPALHLPVIRKIRRNHGLEHATIHLLSRRVKNLSMAGRSSATGFILIGEAPTEQIEQAAREALNRMKKGEHQLAIHPNCGTNLVTTGMLTSLAAVIGTRGGTARINGDRFAGLTIMMMLAVLISQPLGLSLQKHFTTDGDPGDLEIVSVTRKTWDVPMLKQMTVHEVVTRGGSA
ncbi:MAG: DUF6391 domain-containing protein [Anaerolineae bacterium]|jgi:hypothetical protein|nr:DUF6391 domain-containing protein [Anaerolineae bacterium]